MIAAEISLDRSGFWLVEATAPPPGPRSRVTLGAQGARHGAEASGQGYGQPGRSAALGGARRVSHLHHCNLCHDERECEHAWCAALRILACVDCRMRAWDRKALAEAVGKAR